MPEGWNNVLVYVQLESQPPFTLEQSLTPHVWNGVGNAAVEEELVDSTTRQSTGRSLFSVKQYVLYKVCTLHGVFNSFHRIAYLGLTLSLRTISFLICIPCFILLSRQLKEEEHAALHGSQANGGTELEALRKEELGLSNSEKLQRTSENGTDRETRLWLTPPTSFSSHINEQTYLHTHTHTHLQWLFKA